MAYREHMKEMPHGFKQDRRGVVRVEETRDMTNKKPTKDGYTVSGTFVGRFVGREDRKGEA